MSHFLSPTASDLAGWADRRDAQSTLPQLVRRLVSATVAEVSRNSFRADEGVQLGGWDGVVKAAKGNAWVPDGSSGWEMSTNQDIKGKADDDYEKRTKELSPQERAKTTYVFVTPRRWSSKDTWAAARAQEGAWRAVRVLDADDLEQWQAQAPAVALWLARRLGKQPEGARPLEAFWEDWSSATHPRLSTELVRARRPEAQDRLLEWMSQPPDLIQLHADSAEEAIAFLASVIDGLPEDKATDWASRTIVADDAAAWPTVVSSDQPLLLVPRFDAASIGGALNAGHRVLLPHGRDTTPGRGAVVLPALDPSRAHEALQAMGLDLHASLGLLEQSRHRLHALRWRLLLGGPARTPPWADGVDVSLLAAVMLVGDWDGSVEGDRVLVAEVVNRPLEEIEQHLNWVARQTNPPLYRAGDTWRWTCRLEAWPLLSRHFTQPMLKRFEGAVSKVLGAADPALDLPLAEQWAAPIHDKGWVWSDELRQGLAEGLVLLAVCSEQCPVFGRLRGQDRADLAVRRLLAEADDRAWASLSSLLSRLAEAAPDEFLAATESALKMDPSPLRPLFDEAPPHHHGRHSGLLFALETLAWHPPHLSRVALILARLAAMDPGGTVANRPSSTLHRIFLPWHPATAASLGDRQQVLQTVADRLPDLGWALLVDLLPVPHAFAMPAARPDWREWAPTGDPRVTWAELFDAYDHLVSLLRSLAGTDGRRWADLIEHLPRLSEAQREAVVSGLEALRTMGDDDREPLWAGLRRFLHQHRSFPNPDSVMTSEVLDRLDRLYHKFEPLDVVSRSAWLFGPRPERPEGQFEDYQEEAQLVGRLQREAAATVSADGGLEAIRQLARLADAPYRVGQALGATGLPSEIGLPFLTEGLVAEDEPWRLVAAGYVAQRYRDHGVPWVEALVGDSGAAAWSTAGLVQLATALPFDTSTWDWLSSRGPELEEAYWRSVAPAAWGSPRDELEQAARRLLDVDRPLAALRCMVALACQRNQGIDADLAMESLYRAATTDPGDDGQYLSHSNVVYEIAFVFEALDSVDDVDVERLALLEMQYATVLLDSHRPPNRLYAALAEDPSLFVTLLEWQYRSAAGNDEEDARILDQEAIERRAWLSRRLLEGWTGLPGLRDDGTVDADALLAWVRTVRQESEKVGRLRPADREIGHVLSHSPADPDGTWPCEAVRHVLENLDNERVESGMVTGKLNSRGVVTRAWGEGGEQDKQLAEQYAAWADAVANRWPRTAVVLRKLADYYRRDSRWLDERAGLE